MIEPGAKINAPERGILDCDCGHKLEDGPVQYVNLGRSGLKISRLCLGCMTYGEAGKAVHQWTLSEADSQPFFRGALEAGINFFDTANIYSEGRSETVTGRALRDMARRDEIVIATKSYFPWKRAPNTSGLSRKALMQAIDNSLTRLGTDYIDLYQIHRFDAATPLEETMEALHDIVKAGKARYIGASSMAAWQFMKAQGVAERHGWTRFVSMQPQVNLIYREEEREVLPMCIDQGIGVIPWSPLARGKLTREWDDETIRSQTDLVTRTIYSRYADHDRQIGAAVGQVAERHGVSRAEVALAWVLHKPGITAPIIGASKMRHIEDALRALDLVLDASDIDSLEAAYIPHAPAPLMDELPGELRLTLDAMG